MRGAEIMNDFFISIIAMLKELKGIEKGSDAVSSAYTEGWLDAVATIETLLLRKVKSEEWMLNDPNAEQKE